MLRHLRCAAPVLGVLALAPLGRAEAQSAQFGLMAGGSLSTFTGDVTDDVKNHATFLVGGFARLGLGGVEVEPGIVFTRKGTKFTEEGTEVTNSLDYLQIPVVLKIGMPVGATSRFYIGAGPALGIKMGCRFKGSESGFSATVDCDEFSDEEGGIKPKSTELSGIAVAGLEFGKFAIGLRADLGLTNAYEAFLGDVAVEPDLKTRTISAVASIRF